MSFAAKPKLFPHSPVLSSFLPPGPWAQFSLVPEDRTLSFSFKAVASGAILITPGPELIRTQPELAQNVTRRKKKKDKEQKKKNLHSHIQMSFCRMSESEEESQHSAPEC